MEIASSNGNSHRIVEELRNKLSSDLNAMLTEQHNQFQQNLNKWMTQHDGVFEQLARSLDKQDNFPVEMLRCADDSTTQSLSISSGSTSTSSDGSRASAMFLQESTLSGEMEVNSHQARTSEMRSKRRRNRQAHGTAGIKPPESSLIIRIMTRIKNFVESTIREYFFTSIMLINLVIMGSEGMAPTSAAAPKAKGESKAKPAPKHPKTQRRKPKTKAAPK